MRCEEVQTVLEELTSNDTPAPVLEHLKTCAACEGFARRWRQLRAGFALLAAEGAPDASLGFAERLVRRLNEADAGARSAAEFLERVGRRFVYAAALLTLTLMLALGLPSSGPLRGPGTTELLVAQPEIATLGNDPAFAEESHEVRDATPDARQSEPDKNR
jgi:hypothetical protein